MLKAVLFDDEHIVLKGLVKLIDWSAYGVELVATAKDGLTAARLVQQFRPDIVMTDIRMPGMNGLELIELIRSESPHTMCIVFSGYNEFEYVKRAIQLGVIDYLEKPITLAKIKEGIEKAVKRIEEQQRLSSLIEQERKEQLARSTFKLLRLGEEAVSEWSEQFGPDAQRVCGVTVLAGSEEEELLQDGPAYRTVAVRGEDERLTVLFHFDLASGDWKERLHSHVSGTIASGRTYPSLADAPASCREALWTLRYGRYIGRTGWVRYEELGDASTPLNALASIPDFASMQGHSMHEAVDKAIRYMNEHLGRDLTQQEVADYAGVNATYFSELFKEQMGVSYIKYLTKLRVEKAKALLREDLPIQQISEQVGYYHARHFSEVFKKHTGLTPGQFRQSGKVLRI